MSGYRLTPQSLRDLEEIADYIALDNPSRAASFVDELRAACARIAERPHAFRRRDDLIDGLRQAVHGRYLIFLTADQDGVVIERVLHGARRLYDLF